MVGTHEYWITEREAWALCLIVSATILFYLLFLYYLEWQTINYVINHPYMNASLTDPEIVIKNAITNHTNV